jgi:enoyl-CoA hydratase/carnithine racemase
MPKRLFSARQLFVEEALRIGLVNRVVPVDTFDDTVLQLANVIASNAPL